MVNHWPQRQCVRHQRASKICRGYVCAGNGQPGKPTRRYPAITRSDTRYGFVAAIPDIQLNIWNGDTAQSPSRYLIATVAEMDAQLWTVNSIKPNADSTVSLTVAE